MHNTNFQHENTVAKKIAFFYYRNFMIGDLKAKLKTAILRL